MTIPRSVWFIIVTSVLCTQVTYYWHKVCCSYLSCKRLVLRGIVHLRMLRTTSGDPGYGDRSLLRSESLSHESPNLRRGVPSQFMIYNKTQNSLK